MISVILLMAGSGRRMHLDENKILLPLGDKMLFEHSLDLFKEMGYEVICVINKNDEDKVLPKINGKAKYTYGGATRGESVYNGLQLVTGDYVLIHDSARPLISKEVIKNIENTSKNGNSILTYLPVKNTIKVMNNDKLETLDRSKLISAVTPQCANSKLIKDAYQKSHDEKKEFTDDISIIEYYYPNEKIELIEANEEVFKVTTPLDYELLKMVWRKQND